MTPLAPPPRAQFQVESYAGRNHHQVPSETKRLTQRPDNGFRLSVAFGRSFHPQEYSFMASEEHLEIMRSKASVIITLSRPQVLNAITLEMPLRLDEILDALPSDPSVRAIVQHPLSDGLAYEAAATYEIGGTTDCVAASCGHPRLRNESTQPSSSAGTRNLC
jgi:hypothetical protein